MSPSATETPGWVEITFRVHPVIYDALSSFLFDLGCSGLETKDVGDQVLKAYLPLPADLEDVQNRVRLFLENLQEIFPDTRFSEPGFTKVKVEDWSHNWRRFFRPDQVTPGLLVLPSWEPLPTSAKGHVIRIDPGPAFGTGQHQTTRMCLEAMEGIPYCEGWDMLDVGTGSGILAIFGARLGAARVVAIDIDPEALRWARRNIELNCLSKSIQVSARPLEKLKGPFYLLVANLVLKEIVRLLPHFLALMSPEGWLILSGILKDQLDEVITSFPGDALKKTRVSFREEWACIVARKIPR